MSTSTSSRTSSPRSSLQQSCGSVFGESVRLSLPSAKLRVFTNSPFTVPELRVYRVWDKPIGPHPIAMFEVNLFTPAQFGAFIPWLVINRGPLSALLHPNTGDDIRDHTQRATWLGQPFPLQIGLLRRLLERRDEAAKSNQQAK
jgi:aromatic ring-cleaving dioxygenase